MHLIRFSTSPAPTVPPRSGSLPFHGSSREGGPGGNRASGFLHGVTPLTLCGGWHLTFCLRISGCHVRTLLYAHYRDITGELGSWRTTYAHAWPPDNVYCPDASALLQYNPKTQGWLEARIKPQRAVARCSRRFSRSADSTPALRQAVMRDAYIQPASRLAWAVSPLLFIPLCAYVNRLGSAGGCATAWKRAHPAHTFSS